MDTARTAPMEGLPHEEAARVVSSWQGLDRPVATAAAAEEEEEEMEAAEEEQLCQHQSFHTVVTCRLQCVHKIVMPSRY